jgi:hypothetical protein
MSGVVNNAADLYTPIYSERSLVRVSKLMRFLEITTFDRFAELVENRFDSYYPHWFFLDVLDRYRRDFYHNNLDSGVFTTRKNRFKKLSLLYLNKPLAMDFSFSFRRDCDLLETAFLHKDYPELPDVHLLDEL